MPRGFLLLLMEIVLPPTVFEKLVSKVFWLVRKARMEMKRTGEPSSNLKPPVVARMRKFLDAHTAPSAHVRLRS